MLNAEKLDSMLEKLLNITDEYLDYCIENDKYNKDLAESVCMVLSIAYGRIGVEDEQDA